MAIKISSLGLKGLEGYRDIVGVQVSQGIDSVLRQKNPHPTKLAVMKVGKR